MGRRRPLATLLCRFAEGSTLTLAKAKAGTSLTFDRKPAEASVSLIACKVRGTSATNHANGEVMHENFQAIKDGANFLGEEMDITSIAVRFYSALYRFAVSLTRSETDAADLVQETFLALTQRSHQIRDFSQIKSWLFTTLRRKFLRTIRRRKIHYEVEFLPDIHNLPASDLVTWRLGDPWMRESS